jgi:hypothetical protein
MTKKHLLGGALLTLMLALPATPGLAIPASQGASAIPEAVDSVGVIEQVREGGRGGEREARGNRGGDRGARGERGDRESRQCQ